MLPELKRIKLRHYLNSQESQDLAELKENHAKFEGLFNYLFERNVQRRVNNGLIPEKTAKRIEVEPQEQHPLILTEEQETLLWSLIFRVDGYLATKEFQVNIEVDSDEELGLLYNILMES